MDRPTTWQADGSRDPVPPSILRTCLVNARSGSDATQRYSSNCPLCLPWGANTILLYVSRISYYRRFACLMKAAAPGASVQQLVGGVVRFPGFNMVEYPQADCNPSCASLPQRGGCPLRGSSSCEATAANQRGQTERNEPTGIARA